MHSIIRADALALGLSQGDGQTRPKCPPSPMCLRLVKLDPPCFLNLWAFNLLSLPWNLPSQAPNCSRQGPTLLSKCRPNGFSFV